MWIAFWGTLTSEDLLEMTGEVLNIEGEMTMIPPRLSKISDVTAVSIHFSDVYALALRRRKQQFPNRFKSAIVAAGTVQYGFARMFQILNDNPQISVEIFSDEAGALEWLSTR